MSLLTIIQDVCNELTLPAPNSVIGNTDQQTTQLLALSNREGQEFVKLRGPWSGWTELSKTYTFNMVPVGPYTCTMTPGSNILTNCSSTAGLVAGYGAGGTNIYAATTVTSFDAVAQTITLSIAPSNTSVQNNVSVNFGQIQYPLPPDMNFFAPATAWDTNFRWQLLGPLSPQEQEVILRGISPVGPRIRYWFQNKMFNLQPLPGPTQLDLISMRYESTAWCNTAGGNTQNANERPCEMGRGFGCLCLAGGHASPRRQVAFSQSQGSRLWRGIQDLEGCSRPADGDGRKQPKPADERYRQMGFVSYPIKIFLTPDSASEPIYQG